MGFFNIKTSGYKNNDSIRQIHYNLMFYVAEHVDDNRTQFIGNQCLAVCEWTFAFGAFG
jgi:hypothetical protein